MVLGAMLRREWEEKESVEIVWGLVDGFLLYWDPVRVCGYLSSAGLIGGTFQEVVSALDSRLFLRVPHDVLKQRRHERHGYHTAGQSTSTLSSHSYESHLYAL